MKKIVEMMVPGRFAAGGVAALVLLSGNLAAQEEQPRKKVEIFPEIQIFYNAGNNFRNYWHWNDRPLYLDRTARHPKSARYMTEKGVHIDCRIASQYGLSGLSALWRDTLQSFGDMLRFYEKDPLPGFKLLPGTYNPSRPTARKILEEICSHADSPHVFRIDGKMVIHSYEATLASPEAWKKLISEIRKKYGDKFLFVGDMKVICQRYRYRRPGVKDPVAYEKGVMAEIQSYLDVLDGISFYPYAARLDADGDYGEHIDEKTGRMIRELFKKVLADPRNKGKLVACTCVMGYVNPQSGMLNPSEAGTGTLRKTTEAALEMNPDYIIPFEWNEWNENTGVIPTVRKGAAALRIFRYYRQKYNGEKLRPLPFDDPKIPNLILSCRATVKLGERLHCELLNVPDGSGGGPVKAQLSLVNASGKCVEKFPEVSFDPAKLEAKDFYIASEKFPGDLFLRPELTVTAGGTSRVFRAFPPVVLNPTHNIDYLYTRLPLRECAEVSGNFTVTPEKEGFFRIRGKVSSAEELNTLEVMERHDEAAAIETKPEFDREKFEVFRVCSTSNQWQVLQGTITVPGVPETVARNWFVGADHHHLLRWEKVPCGIRINVASGGSGTRSVLLSVPRGKAASAKIRIQVKQGTLEFKIADILKYGSCAAELAPAIFWRADRVVSEPDIPDPLRLRDMSFDLLVRSEERFPIFSIRAVTSNGRRWQSDPAVPEFPAGKKVTLPIHSDTERKISSVEVVLSRIPDARYTFDPASGKMLTTPWQPAWAAEAGGGYRYNLNNSRGRTAPPETRHIGPDWQQTEKDGDFLRFTKYSSLTFLPGVWPLGAFTVEFEVRPAAADGILLRHSNPKQTYAIGLFIVDGKLFLLHSNSAGHFRSNATPLELPAGRWSKVKVSSDIKSHFVSVNGKTWQAPRIGRGRVAAPLVFGSDACRDFMPKKDFPGFTGDLRSLRITHQFEK